MWSRGVIVLIIGLFVVGCGTKRKTISRGNDGGASVAHVGTMEINNLDFHSFSGRAKAQVEFGRQQQDVTLNFRINRNKAIWISVTALLGIEVARVLITPDSVRILNKLQGEYLAKPFEYIHRYTSTGVTFEILQDLLMANVSTSLLQTDQLTTATSEEELQLVGIKDQLSFQYSLNTNRRPKVFRLLPVGTDQSVESYYGKYADINGYEFPQNQNIQLQAGNIKVSAVLEYTTIRFNDILELPFSVPARYKVLE